LFENTTAKPTADWVLAGGLGPAPAALACANNKAVLRTIGDAVLSANLSCKIRISRIYFEARVITFLNVFLQFCVFQNVSVEVSGDHCIPSCKF
jgi:hypothetical protein